MFMRAVNSERKKSKIIFLKLFTKYYSLFTKY